MESKNSAFALLSEKIKSAIVDVEFGSPMKNCLHFGICRVNIPSASVGAKKCPCCCLATITALDTNLIQFVFDMDKMHVQTFKKHFTNYSFQIEDEYEMPKEIMSLIGLGTFVIKKGTYPILLEGHLLKLLF